MKRIISFALALVMLASFAVVASAAESGDSVSVRIEGISQNLFAGSCTLGSDEVTVKDMLSKLVSENDSLKITGIDTNYITDINGDKAGSFGGYDGWYYAVNNIPGDTGIDGCKLKAGDNVVLYYGGFPCQVPVADYSEADMGTISFKSYDTTYDENWNPTSDWAPVAVATVTLNGDTYTTDDEGKIYFEVGKYSGKVTVQISKADASGAPAVCRFSDSEGFVAKSNSDIINFTKVTHNLTVYVNTNFKTVYSVFDNLSGKTKFESSNTKVATVTSKGKVKLLKKGKATITISNSSTKSTIEYKFTVKNPTLKKTKATIKKGASVKVNVNGSGKFTFKSKNTKIATVSKKGKVTGKKKGSTKIYVTANGKKLTFSVKVR